MRGIMLITSCRYCFNDSCYWYDRKDEYTADTLNPEYQRAMFAHKNEENGKCYTSETGELDIRDETKYIDLDRLCTIKIWKIKDTNILHYKTMYVYLFTLII